MCLRALEQSTSLLGIAAPRESHLAESSPSLHGQRGRTTTGMEAPQRVYDALDARNYKTALKLCEKNAKKNPVLAALRCLTLQRMRRNQEASQACDELLQKHAWTDENVLAPLTMTLNALGRDVEATACWADGFAAKPSDVGLGRRVCAAHAREGDWPKVRAVAALLYKGTKDRSYLRRFAAAALVEATALPPPPTKLLTLKLGDKMLERAIAESGGYARCSAEDVELLASLREAQGDGPGAAHALRQARDGLACELQEGSPFVRRPTGRDLKRSEAAQLLKGRAITEARALYAELLDGDDDWCCYEGYVKASQTLSLADDALRHLDALAADRPRHRGPQLAALVLVDGAELQRRILAYVEAHAASPSCFDDLETSLRQAGRFDVKVEGPARQKATVLCIRRFLGLDVPVDTCLAVMAGDDPSAAADAACVLAATLLDQDHNVDACRVLYRAHEKDKDNARVTLAYVDALQRIGAGEAALRTYARLGVKQIQLDSLGHVLTPWASSAGFWAETSLHCRNILHVHDNFRRDSREFAHRALDCANAARAAEIWGFQRDRLDRSTTKLWARCELIGLDLVLQGHSASKVIELLPQWETGPRLEDISDDDTFERVFGSLNSDVRARPAWTFTTTDVERQSRLKFVFRNSAAYHCATRELLAALLTGRSVNAGLVDQVLASIRGAMTDPLEMGCVDAAMASYEACSAHKSDREASTPLFAALSTRIAAVATALAGLADQTKTGTVAACAARLRGAAVVLERTAPLLVVLCFVDDHSAKKKKAKGKKAKGKPSEETPFRTALDGALAAFLQLLTSLKASLKRDASDIDDDAPAALPEESVLPADESRNAVAKLLGSARRVSLGRLLGVCGDKIAVLQSRCR